MPENNENDTFYTINPVVGFRAWRVRKTPQGKWALFSLVISGWSARILLVLGFRKKVPKDKYGYWPTKVHTAACPLNDADVHLHKVPEMNCTCGIYTYNDLNLRNLGRYGGDVVGAVKLWGEILQHTKDRGSRAEYAEILALAVSKQYKPLLTKRVKQLCKDYDIPFVGIKDLPRVALEHGEPLLEMEVDYYSSSIPKRLRNLRRLFWSLWAVNVVFFDLVHIIPNNLYWVFQGPQLVCLVILILATISTKMRHLFRLDK